MPKFFSLNNGEACACEVLPQKDRVLTYKVFSPTQLEFQPFINLVNGTWQEISEDTYNEMVTNFNGIRV